jgi:CRP-like cAMP-binding protein
VRDYKAGDVIFKQGDDAHELFIVQSGKVEIFQGDRVLETLSDHGIFGEMALIDSAPRSATAVAITDATLIPVSEDRFLSLISNAPNAIANMNSRASMRSLVRLPMKYGSPLQPSRQTPVRHCGLSTRHRPITTRYGTL